MSTKNNGLEKGKRGVILMTYGSATTEEHVAEYFGRIYHGKASAETISKFEERYRAIGRSPLVEITRAQAQALEARLGDAYIVRAGMRHSAPFIRDAIADLKATGATSVTGIILAPQFSSVIMEGYLRDFEAGAEEAGITERNIVPAWPAEEHFIDLIASRIRDAGVDAPIVFTTHSMPLRVIENDPKYLEELAETVNAIRKKLPENIEWYAGYQSAGHTPEAWLTPDLTDILDELNKKGSKEVLIAPIQFLADHLEVLYDLDIAARKECISRGIVYHRIELPNTDKRFIEALAALVTLNSGSA